MLALPAVGGVAAWGLHLCWHRRYSKDRNEWGALPGVHRFCWLLQRASLEIVNLLLCLNRSFVVIDKAALRLPPWGVGWKRADVCRTQGTSEVVHGDRKEGRKEARERIKVNSVISCGFLFDSVNCTREFAVTRFALLKGDERMQYIMMCQEAISEKRQLGSIL